MPKILKAVKHQECKNVDGLKVVEYKIECNLLDNNIHRVVSSEECGFDQEKVALSNFDELVVRHIFNGETRHDINRLLDNLIDGNIVELPYRYKELLQNIKYAVDTIGVEC